MIPILTIEQMRRIDQLSIAGNINTGFSYMAAAGRRVFEAALEMLRANGGAKNVAVICGGGNNGGDGYIAARMLHEAGFSVDCFSLCESKDLSGEALLAFKDYRSYGGSTSTLSSIKDLPDLNRYNLIIDAMLGTGTKGAPRGLYADVIDAVNLSKAACLAVDTPSGLDSDNAVPSSPCIKADRTVAAGFPKLGQFFYPGRAFIGRLEIADLGYPQNIVKEQSGGVFLPDNKFLADNLPVRKEYGSKMDHGLALLVCGSRGMSGAAALASMAALRCGCGMVHLAVPESIADSLSVKITEPVMHPLTETVSGTSSVAALHDVLSLSERMDSLCIGCGLSRDPQTALLARELVCKTEKPAVLDADGLNAFEGHLPELERHAGELVLTPHMGEWKRLFGQLDENPLARIEALRERAARFNVNILLKGNPSIAVNPKGKAVILPFGDSSLAKAGTGDVLSGIIASLIAQGCPCFEAAISGAYLHGEAGRLAGIELTRYCVLAGDLMGYIPKAIRGITRKSFTYS
ncbi:MAG: NAD(P)H-hydrate dehydratase [Chitinispirillales bacterium]|jgi:NAD(P)H-hydrate epimerase|nr:NAD(P)H-hydrate dehydratase [Chitinispirillales bacterium]